MGYPSDGLSSCQFVFLGLSVVELVEQVTDTTDGQTDTAHHLIMPPHYGGRDIINFSHTYKKREV